jgi:3-phosphoshikimate 1-carboxyvinyltransferase
MRVDPVRSLKGSVTVPGDKSISHRYAILAGMASGTSYISNYSSSKDCQSTLTCLQILGVDIQRTGNQVKVTSPGWKELAATSPNLDAGNSGTTIRLLSALLAACPHDVLIFGDSSLNQRPMKRIIAPLNQMGAEIRAREGQFPPLRIRGRDLTGIRYKLPVASAQVKSCVLLAGLTAKGETVVIEETPSRDHTERALPYFRVPFEKKGQQLKVTGGSALEPLRMIIPGDISSAVYFAVAALLVAGAQVEIPGVGINPTRYGLMTLLENSGARLDKEAPNSANSEPICDLSISYSDGFLKKFPREVRGKWIPNVIDEIPILAVLGTRLKHGLTVRDASELRKKESDRIQSIVINLRSLGVDVEEFSDGFHIPPAQSIRGGKVKSFGDHRIAMAFSIAGLISEQGIEIDDPDCVDISFPGFFDTLSSLVDR